MNVDGTEYGSANSPLDRRLTRALQSPPVMEIPADFARRVAGKAAAHRSEYPVREPLGVGVRLAWSAAVLLLVVVAALAVSKGSFYGKQWLELGFEIEFAALTAWLCLRARLQT